jgi:hypothetical protein
MVLDIPFLKKRSQQKKEKVAVGNSSAFLNGVMG